MATSSNRVIVIGAGFSGLLTTIHLLRLDREINVTLVDRRSAFGPGTAYDTGNPDHLLNVRLGNMSAFPDDPDHLSNWLAGQPSWQASGEFITRGTYGAYLRSLLDQAVADDPDRLTLVHGRAIDLEYRGDGWRLHLEGGGELKGDAIVLAIGNQEPTTPTGVDDALRQSRLYRENPWSGEPLASDDALQVLLVGSGLTAVDVAIGLEKPGRVVTAISRHGLMPRAHASASLSMADTAFSGSPAIVMGQARREAAGRDWREVFDALRHQAGDLWRGWTPRQRLQFARHIRPLWEVHRHRMAPVVARRVAGLIADGALSVIAGKLVELKLNGGGVEVAYRPRGRRRITHRRFDMVINCTGPLGRVTDSRDPLIVSLLRRGLARPDPLGLGFHVDEQGVLPGSDIRKQRLRILGPLGRGAFWEMTSVPDLRVQAKAIAAGVRLAVGDGPAGVL